MSDYYSRCIPNKYKTWKRVKNTDENGRDRMKLVSEVKGTKDGFRIVNLGCLQTYIHDITIHAIQCKDCHELDSPIELLGEVWSMGLASVIAARCKGCGMSFELKSPRMGKNHRFEINVRAVWGQMVTGGGAAKLGEQCATMGMPTLSQTSFSAIEEEIGKWWSEVCLQLYKCLVRNNFKQMILIFISPQTLAIVLVRQKLNTVPPQAVDVCGMTICNIHPMLLPYNIKIQVNLHKFWYICMK